MVRLSTRGLLARALAVAALFTAAACTDNVSPTGTAALADAAAPSASHAAGHLHTGKYRDSSLPHATGRSGSATLSALAILGGDGITRLTVTSGSVYAPGEARGELSKVQIKAWGPDGEKLLNTNVQRPTTGPTHEFLLHGLPPGARIQVQANVRGIDRNRTDVVTVTETSKLGPALSVTIDPLGNVVVGVPTTVTATVRETNGDVGTTTTCILYVDGVEVDRAEGVWVDAGDGVTCAFTHTFERAGSHELRVELVDGAGGGGLVGGGTVPTDEMEVDATDPNPLPAWRATVMDRTVETDNRFDVSWWRPDGSFRRYEDSSGEAPRSQTISLTGTLARATTFPLGSVRLTVGSNAAGVFQSSAWSGLVAAAPDAAGQTCVSQLAPEHGGHFTLCSTGSGYQGSTTFGYTRFGGTVTYHSRGFNRIWDTVVGTETYWSWNQNYTTYASGAQVRNLGTSVGIQMSVADGVGEWSIDAAVPLASFSEPVVQTAPYLCRDESPYWLLGGVQTICQGSTAHTFGWSGEAAG
jgi:hypothetical protein